MPRTDEESPLSISEINDFTGIYLQIDSSTLPPGGAQVQINIKSDQRGCLTVRDGMLPISFDASVSY